jgi:protein transport protein SEC24
MYSKWDAEVIDQSTFHVSRLSSDSTAVFQLVHGERLEGVKHVYFQAACLYTNKLGQRLIRVHTLQLQCSNSLSNVFRYTEVESVVCLLLKQAACCALQGNAAFKEKLTKDCVDMLYAYRVHCASTTSAGQLILPESLKLLPLYACSIRKMAIFRSGSDLRVDDRMAGLIRLLSLPIAQVAPLVYPRVYTLAPLGDTVGKLTGVGDNVHMPPTIAATEEKLQMDRIFLIDNGLSLHIYIREHVQPQMLDQAFAVSTPSEVSDVVAAFNVKAPPTEEGRRLWQVVQQIRRERYRLPWQSVFVATSGTAEEARVIASLVEDRVAGEMQYVDYLCHVHKQVQLKLD